RTDALPQHAGMEAPGQNPRDSDRLQRQPRRRRQAARHERRRAAAETEALGDGSGREVRPNTVPDPSALSVGDRIRIIAVPRDDMLAFESGSTYLENTVRVLQWMVGKEFTISWIDDDGKPWVQVGYPDPEGGEHAMAILDSE